MSSKDSDEIRIMYTTSNNIKIMMDNETNEIIKEKLILFCTNIKND